MTSMFTEDALNARLLPRAEGLLCEWCGDVKVEGDEIVMCNPARDDQHLGSFKFNRQSGAWCDFAEPDRFSGYGLVSLYAAINRITTDEAIAQLTSTAGSTAFVLPAPAKQATAADLGIQPVHEEEAGVPLPPDVHPELGPPTAVYRYLDAHGRTVFYVYRFDVDGKKETRPLSWSTTKEKWAWKYPPPPWPLYARGPAEGDVLVVEGEKTADAAATMFPNHRVVTSACGSGQSCKSDWSSLKSRNVIISPDNDAPGRQYALDVAGHATANGAASIAIIDNGSLDWAAGDDLADHSVDDSYLSHAISMEQYAEPSEREAGIVEAAALLGPGHYDRIKDQLAKSLGIGVRTLNGLVRPARLRLALPVEEEPGAARFVLAEAEPWDHQVDAQALFDEIVAALSRHVVLKPEQAVAVALWIMLSWLFERFKILPQLLLTSPIKRCGKTTLLELISYMVNRALAAANLSSAAIFRSVESLRPTLLVDEADTLLGGNANPEMTGILNSGHNRATAFVLRVQEVDGQHETVRFSTFCPKVLAMIGTPPDTQLDRSITIELERKPASHIVHPLGLDADQTFHDLRRKLARWRDDTPDTFKHDLEACPLLPNDRARQNWSALLSVARHVGDAVYVAGLNAVALLADTSHLEEDRSADLLEDIRSVFIAEKADRLPSKILLKRLNDMPDRPWASHNRGKEMNGHGLGRMLKPFKVKSKPYKDGAKPVKGYLLANLQPVFDRYLNPQDVEKSD